MDLKQFFVSARQRIFLPIGAVTEFGESADELRKKLNTKDPSVAQDILAQAENLFAEVFDRAEGAERRATTLLGAAAIPGSLTVGGGGLLLDRPEISGFWRFALLIGYFVAIGALIGSVLRAARVLAVQRWTLPGDDLIFRRAAEDLPQGNLLLASHLLHSVGRNRPVARWKVAQLRASIWWFTIAVVALLYTAAVITLVIAAGSQDQPSGNGQRAPSTETPGP